MLNGNEWHELHGDFLYDTRQLLTRADECLSHLDLISDDKDAIEGLLSALQQIAGKADTASVPSIAGFARQLRYLLYFSNAAGRFSPKALLCLHQCLSLLSWQIELVDPLTGHLDLDDHEQHHLLEQLGCCCGITQTQDRYSVPADWSITLTAAHGTPDALPGEHADHPILR